MPDEFQFYTLNGNGELVMKQMTKQEIQGMLAASGDGLEIGQHHQTQLPVSSDEAKVGFSIPITHIFFFFYLCKNLLTCNTDKDIEKTICITYSEYYNNFWG